MKVKMKKGAASPEGAWGQGVSYEVPEQMPLHAAQNFVSRGVAEWTDPPEEDEYEAAVDDHDDAERADARPRRRRRRG